MKKKYYVSRIKQHNGDHEVHDETCEWLPKPENRIYIGDYESCYGAVRAAKTYFTQVNGCKYCSKPCHTQ